MALDTDLVTLDEASDFLQRTASQTAADDILADLISRASLVIQRQLDLEVAPPESATKVLSWDGSCRVQLVPFVARQIGAVTLDPDESGEDALATTEFRLGPEPAPDGVYYYLELDARAIGSYGGNFGSRRIELTGSWGFAAVPEELKHACCVTVTAWYRGQVAAFSGQYDDADGGFPARVDLLPRDAFRVLENWRRFVI